MMSKPPQGDKPIRVDPPTDPAELSTDATHAVVPKGEVLLLDRDPVELLATAGTLHHAGFRCRCARSLSSMEKAASGSRFDMLVIRIRRDAEAVLQTLDRLRYESSARTIPAVLIADSRWAGLEKRVENLAATRCLFCPVDPNVLIDLVQQLLWMPNLVEQHRRRGRRPLLGWVTLDS